MKIIYFGLIFVIYLSSSAIQIDSSIYLKKHIFYGKNKWSGKSDLSFKYRLIVENDTLNLMVSVIDDSVVNNHEKPLNNDHVEIWLGDNSLLKFKQKLSPVFYKNEEISEDEIEMQKKAQKEYFIFENTYTFSQIIIYKDSIVNETFHKRCNYPYSWNKNDSGYQISLKIPMLYTFPVLTKNINNLNYSIDVFDNDSELNDKQECGMSSCIKNKYNNLKLFNKLNYNFKINNLDTIYNKLKINGYYFPNGSLYEFYFIGFRFDCESMENIPYIEKNNFQYVVNTDKYIVITNNDSIYGVGTALSGDILFSKANEDSLFILVFSTTPASQCGSSAGAADPAYDILYRLFIKNKINKYEALGVPDRSNQFIEIDTLPDNTLRFITEHAGNPEYRKDTIYFNPNKPSKGLFPKNKIHNY